MSNLKPLALCCLVALLFATTLAASEKDAGRLVEAAKRGDEKVVGVLLKQGVDANTAVGDGATALHWAAHLDEFEMAELLVRAGAKVNTANRYRVVPLTLASTNGNATMLELLLGAGADPNIALPGGETPLMIAARTGRPEAVRVLLSHGARLKTHENSRNQTALMWAAAEGHVKTVQTLLKAGADIEARSKRGFSPFLFAVRQGHIEVVQTLLREGANLNQALSGRGKRQDTEPSQATGANALDLAVTNAHYELATILLEAGINPNGARQGRTPLHAITWIRKPGAGSNAPAPRGSGKMDSLEFVKTLAEHGADLNARMTTRSGSARTVLNMRGATPFLLAARTADAELMRLLAKMGADPLIPNEDKTTPLMVAAGVGVQAPGEDPGTESEVFEAVKVALELGGDVNAVDNKGNTAMHGAAYKHVASVVTLLVENGAKIEVWNHKNKLKWTPLKIATGVHRGMNFRSSPETAAAIRKALFAAGVSTSLDP